MTEVSTYDLSYKLQNLQDRVDRIEKERLKELEERSRRAQERHEAFMRWFLFGMILILAIAWTAIITTAIVEQ